MADKVLFIDRDGTLIQEPDDMQVDALGKLALVADVIPALLRLRDAGFRFIIVSNQDGLGTDSFPQAAYRACQDQMLALFESQGIRFDEVFVCPHLEEERCECRKPRTGLLTRYLAANTIDLERSAVIGDRATDIALAENLGIRGYLIDANGGFDNSWAGIANALIDRPRAATVKRATKETSIVATVTLDSDGPSDIRTGIGFFDHMLEQVSKHGGFRLDVACSGDLHIDEHHTVEDSAICIGQALREALGDKRGIGRYGYLLPMDESEAKVSLDLSGRGAFRFDGDFTRDSVGELSIEMVKHFFASLADAAGAALHIEVSGDNAHHMVEACCKSVGRALRPALQTTGGELPTTKGVLS
ncbi:MAG: bifunctional histidinol-phosphatase/imidazoleglycerol-phosphate dehydratase HisB [Gammaproteobacteria bacterium]|nr:bifunctional histidinol-phosphatase/imidazoleglycerol-phosphate dehydratase HisB [Gammaproteobacteria bacterium]